MLFWTASGNLGPASLILASKVCADYLWASWVSPGPTPRAFLMYFAIARCSALRPFRRRRRRRTKNPSLSQATTPATAPWSPVLESDCPVLSCPTTFRQLHAESSLTACRHLFSAQSNNSGDRQRIGVFLSRIGRLRATCSGNFAIMNVALQTWE